MQRREEAVAIEVDAGGATVTTNESEHLQPRRINKTELFFRFLRFLIHFVIFGFYGNVVRLDWTHYTPLLIDYELIDDNILDHFQSLLYKTVYLSTLNVILQLFYFFWCCITDLISASAGQSSIGRSAVKFRDWLLAAVVFPIGTLVVIIFWSIYAVDRELIFPEKLDRFFPSWLNHALHTFVLPLLLVDMLLVKHKYPSRTSGMLGAAAFGLAYLIWILYLGFAEDIWVYPFMQALEGPYFAVFFTVSSLFLFLIYIIGEKLNGLFAGKGKESSTQKID